MAVSVRTVMFWVVGCGLWHCVHLEVDTDVLEEVASSCLLSHFDPEDEYHVYVNVYALCMRQPSLTIFHSHATDYTGCVFNCVFDF